MEVLATSAVRSNRRRGVWVPAFAGDNLYMWLELYASPWTSNIAASIASCADLPAQITNWNEG